MFSPENWPVERHIQNMAEKVIEKPFGQAGRYVERMKEEDVDEAVSIINDFFYFIFPKDEMLSLDNILSKAKVAIFRHGVQGVVIDPWNEIEHDYERMTEAQYLSKALSKIRQFARKHHVHVWVVAHPRNLVKADDGSYKPPTMYEISGGAHWRNKADCGICLHRHDYDNDETSVYVQKIRFREVGKPGDTVLRFSRETGIYSEVTKQPQGQYL
jgi:twinkle protein